MKKNSFTFFLSLALTGGVVVMFLISLIYLPKDPNKMNTAERFALPCAEFPLGSDQFGRDVLSRIMSASQSALMVGLGSVAVGTLCGVIIGSFAAMSKGVLRGLSMRVIDGLMAFPGTLLAMLMVAVVGKGIRGSVIAIGVFMVPSYSRLVYGMIMENQSMPYIKAAKSYGCGNAYLVVRHFLPVMLPRLVTQFSSSVGGAVMVESSLSFLGLGVQAPNASWGLMLSEARQFVLSYPYIAVAPGIAVLITVLGFNLLGDAFNDILVARRSDC